MTVSWQRRDRAAAIASAMMVSLIVGVGVTGGSGLVLAHDGAQPAPAEPAPSEPAPSEPAAAEPAATEPAPAEPTPSEPPAAEPASAEPAPAEPPASSDAPAVPPPSDPAPAEAASPAEPPKEEMPAETPAADAPAAEAPAAPTPSSPEAAKIKEEFKAQYDQFRDRLVRLEKIFQSYQTADSTEMTDLQKQWADEIAAGRKELPELRKVTIAAWEAGVERNGDVGNLLADILADEAKNDRYEDAYQIAKALLTEEAFAKRADLVAAGGIAAAATNHFEAAEPWLMKAVEGRSEEQNVYAMLSLIKDQEYAKAWEAEQAIREAEAKADDLPRVKLETSKGTIVVELFENEAPQTVGNFVSLVKKGFYDGTPFHRVLPGFMAQGGDPTGTGTGGPGYRIFDEHGAENARKHFRGVLSMANTGAPNTGGSQFFLTFVPTAFLNGRHAVFGRVIEGMDVLAEIQRIDPDEPKAIRPDKIVKATVIRDRGHEYKPSIAKQGD